MPYAAGIDEKEGLFEFASFKGLRNNVDPESFSPEDLVTALNVDIDDAGGISRRKGFSSPVVAGVDRALFAAGSVCLGVGSNALKLIQPDWSTTTLRSGLAASRPLSYAAVGNRVFWSNGVETGCVQDGVSRTWGLEVPAAPEAAAVSGTLRAGTYQYVITYLREDGQESGASKAGTITLAAVGGISLSPIAVSDDPSVVYKVVYVTAVDGETLYRYGVAANADTSFVIRGPRAGASPLSTQFLRPAPAGDHIGYGNGRMLVAADSRLYPSEPFAPELFDLRRSVPFLDRITLLAPLSGKDAGIWIGTASQIIWVSGEGPETWAYDVKAEYGVIPGTAYYSDSSVLAPEPTDPVPVVFFGSRQGLCVGRPGGVLLNLTEDRFAYPVMDRGAALVRRHRGMVQCLMSLQGTEVAGNVAA